jgi:hypothetical protein
MVWIFFVSLLSFSMTKVNVASGLDNIIIRFIRDHRIDSFQKLRLLLFYQQYPNFEGTASEIALKLHLADTQLVRKTILDFKDVNLIVRTDHRWKLSDRSEVVVALELLAHAFEQPLTRQKLLDQVKDIYSGIN